MGDVPVCGKTLYEQAKRGFMNEGTMVPMNGEGLSPMGLD